MSYTFLAEMADDPYFPAPLVRKGQQLLLDTCATIETTQPKTLPALYAITHNTTERFNELDVELNENDSEIETVARENIAEDMDFIARAYGFDADVEELIAPRDW